MTPATAARTPGTCPVLLLAFGLAFGSGLFTASPAAETLRLATTTSTEATGLLAVLLPAFKAEHGIDVQVIAVGTGKALRLLGNGDVDVSVTHALDAERKLVDAGLASGRTVVMYNDFVLVGPPEDPAGAAEAPELIAALRGIARSGSVFVSRGDASGTHMREQKLWSLAGAAPDPAHYRETGQGMGKTLQIAAELGGYTLTDRGSWLAMRRKLPLALCFQGDEHLFNLYAVMIGNPIAYPEMNHAAARRFASWLTGARAQALIGEFRVDGELLFVPRLSKK